MLTTRYEAVLPKADLYFLVLTFSKKTTFKLPSEIQIASLACLGHTKKQKQIMARSKKNNGFTPPPHVNARVHRRIMAKLKTMSSEEMLQTFIDAGILTKDQKFTKPYKDLATK